jgi:hypothetical protein
MITTKEKHKIIELPVDSSTNTNEMEKAIEKLKNYDGSLYGTLKWDKEKQEWVRKIFD